MGKAIAIALTQDNSLTLTTKSLLNLLRLAADFMYGTPERVKYTYAFAVGLAILSCALGLSDSSAFSACSHDTLVNAL